ncbi:MAG: 50S ribosomal protein L24 [Acidiferrobacterales bacterium]|nr:50S ribosomal protein L24 [Acidiferrobacterales bacterium]
MNRIRKGDDVIVIAGRDRGKRGTVLNITADGRRALVNDVNIVKKHTRPNPNANQTGGIVSKEAPIQLSNLAVYNPATGKADRIGFRFLEDGTKVRYFKSNDEVLT